MIRSSSERWRQRSRRSTGERLAPTANEGGRAAQLAGTRYPEWSCPIQVAPACVAGDVGYHQCRNFEKAAHEVLAASKRHQMHAKISCLSFLRRKPLDELSVSSLTRCDVAPQTCNHDLAADRHVDDAPCAHEQIWRRNQCTNID